jgi:sensor histidine kinase YesM
VTQIDALRTNAGLSVVPHWTDFGVRHTVVIMLSYTDTTPSAIRSKWNDTLFLLAASTLFWALAAVLLTWAAPGLGSFGRILIFTEANGTAIVVGFLLVRRTNWFVKQSSISKFLLIVGLLIPTGYVIGHAIAFTLLGEPLRMISEGQDRMVPVVFTLLYAGFGIYYLYTREQLARAAVARSEAQLLAAESQLRMLRAQIEPHMLFNTLANLRSLIDDDTQKAQAMLDLLIVYLRSALSASRTETTTLRAEFAQLRAYLEIMSLRMGPRLTYRLELPDVFEQTAVPPMLLQPLVENAIKHGLEPKVGAGSVDVIARRTDAGVEISVADSGLGLPPQDEGRTMGDSASNSYGLQHVRARLQAAYGPRATLTLAPQQPRGTCATVRIPL